MNRIFFAMQLSMPLFAISTAITAGDVQKAAFYDPQVSRENTYAANLGQEHSLLAERYPLEVQYFTQRFKQLADEKALPLGVIHLIKQYLINNHRMDSAEISENFAYTDDSLTDDSKKCVLFSIFSPDERFIITVTDWGAFFVKNLKDSITYKIERKMPTKHYSYIFSADGNKMFLATGNGIVLMLDLTNPNNVTLKIIADGDQPLSSDDTTCLAVNDDTTKLLVGNKNCVMLYNLSDLKNKVLIENGHRSYQYSRHPHIKALAFVSNNSMLVGFLDGTLVYCNLNEPLETIHLNVLPRDNRMYRSFTDSGTCQLGVLFPENPPVRRVYYGSSLEESGLYNMAFSSDGRLAVIANREKTDFYPVENLWQTGFEILSDVFDNPALSDERDVREPLCMQFNADNTRLMVSYRACSQLTLFTISPDMSKITAIQLPSPDGPITSLAFSKPSAHLAVTSKDAGENRICLWDLSDLSDIRRFFPPMINKKIASAHGACSFSFTADASCLLIGNAISEKNPVVWPLTQFLDILTLEQIKAFIDTSNNSDLLFHEPYNSILLGIPNEYLRKLIFKHICSQSGARDTESKAALVYKKSGLYDLI